MIVVYSEVEEVRKYTDTVNIIYIHSIPGCTVLRLVKEAGYYTCTVKFLYSRLKNIA